MKELREMAERLSLFDAEFYRHVYGAMIGEKDETFTHYMAEGEGMGFRPSPRFDPAAYRAAYEDVAEARVSPLMHYIIYGMAEGRLAQPDLQSLFPAARYETRQCRNPSNADLKVHDHMTAAEAKELAAPASITLEHGGARYKIQSPEAGFLMDVLERNVPFACVRRMHGLWDTLASFFLVEEEITGSSHGKKLLPQERHGLAERISYRQTGSCLSFGHVFTENFLREIIDDLEHLPDDPHFYQALAFKGNPTPDNRVFLYPGATPEDDPHLKRVVQTFTRFFKEERTFLDGTYLKRGVLSGAYKSLPDYMRRHPVVMVGPPWFRDLGTRWRLEDYNHIAISSLNAASDRNIILERCLDTLQQAEEHSVKRNSLLPVVIFQCSASLAAWFIYRLHKRNRSCIYVDFGQALNAWYLDESFYNSYLWTNIYRETIVENMKLEDTYRALTGPCYESWLAAKAM